MISEMTCTSACSMLSSHLTCDAPTSKRLQGTYGHRWRSDRECRGYGISSRLLPTVFRNLSRNSAVYAGEATVITVSVTKSGDETCITVSDNGPGIALSVRGQLFEKSVTASEITGLGLYLTRRIVELYGGTIDLLNADGREGCAYLVTLSYELI